MKSTRTNNSDKTQGQIMLFPRRDPSSSGEPLLKWPGGKRRLVKHILPLVPKDFAGYYEPFLGGGALFFALQPKVATLSDNNAHLINCYIQVRDHSKHVIARLKRFHNSETEYYKVRAKVPGGAVAQAARFIYLTTLSFNGIHRLNLRGEFNVPYGHKTHLDPSDPGRIRRASRVLRGTELRCADFEAATIDARKGDLVYFDPPYTVAHGNNGFLKYNAKIFSWDDQTRLARVARNLANRGCRVIVSNACHSSIVKLYEGFRFLTVSRPSTIAASKKFRGHITECIFYNGV